MSETTRKGEQPSGEAWERLVEACREYRDLMKNDKWYLHPYIAKIVAAFEAYEAAQSAEPSDRQATIERLAKERDEARTESHAYKSRLREFCQRLVDMVGAEGPEDVQGMLDKVNAELHRLKQNIDSMSANLADKEGFLNSAGDEIERLTKERDELRVTIDLDRANWDRVQDANYRTIAELQARLAKPEMPAILARLLNMLEFEFPEHYEMSIAAVRDYYATPFRIDGLGVYETEDGHPWEVIYIDPKGGVVARHETTKLLENFHVSGSCKGGNFSLTKYLRPLEG